MSTFKNEFSWSISRDRVFQICPRQYYFNYYGYWGGWENDASKRTRKIFILKQLQNRFMWAGAKVHDCINHTLTNLQHGISVLDYVVGSIVDMQSLLVDSDENVPKEEDAFLKVEEDRVRSVCNFRKVCK